MKEEQKKEMNQEENSDSNKFGKRTPLYAQKASGIKEKKGFVRYQVLEKPGEVEKWMRAGWRPVTDEGVDLRDNRLQHDKQLGTILRSVVNRRPGASSQTAIWMEIEEKFYNEDKAAKEKLYNESKATWNPKNIQKSNPGLYYSGDLKSENKFEEDV